jgi:hypothetical protein
MQTNVNDVKGGTLEPGKKPAPVKASSVKKDEPQQIQLNRGNVEVIMVQLLAAINQNLLAILNEVRKVTPQSMEKPNG